jgi:hypothetical protein
VKAFLKRIAVVALHFDEPTQAGMVLFIKQCINKYPSVRDIIESPYTSGETDKAEKSVFTVSDPQLIKNVHLVNIYKELESISAETENKSIQGLVKSIFEEKNLPSELLNIQPLMLTKSLYLRG